MRFKVRASKRNFLDGDRSWKGAQRIRKLLDGGSRSVLSRLNHSDIFLMTQWHQNADAAMSLRSHSPTILDQQSCLIPNVGVKSSIGSSPSSTTEKDTAVDITKFVGKMLCPTSPNPESCSAESCGDVNNTGILRLEFADFVDLQTRLVLLPRVEDEGRGAVIASYQPKPVSDIVDEPMNIDTKGSADEPQSPHQNTAEPSQEYRDDEETKNKTEVNGSIFLGLESKEEDWSEKDFSEILASLRQEETSPFALVFQPPTQNTVKEGGSPPSTETATVEAPSQSEAPIEMKNKNALSTGASANSGDSLQTGMSALSAWGLRMRAQASEAATTLSSAAKERAKQFQPPAHKGGNGNNCTKLCEIFIQTSVGAFVPVSLAQSRITTNSLLLIRRSVTEAAPPSGWSYRWYRSSLPSEYSQDDSASEASSTTSRSRGSNNSVLPTPEAVSASNIAVTEDFEWVAIYGATHAAFQPDATLTGRRVRCVVTMAEVEDAASSDDSDCMDSVDMGSIQSLEEVCELNSVVWADPALFNGARQALARGAKFGGFKGQGNASGRLFRVEVSIGMPSKKQSRRTTSSLRVHQVSGNESVTLTPKPILQATAHAPSSSPKHLHLQLSARPDSMLLALCTDGLLQLETPNRLTRESFLMALGIANFPGKPADLDAKTILYRDNPEPLARNLMDDDASISSASCASSVLSHRSGRKSITSAHFSSPTHLGPQNSHIQSVAPATPNSLTGTPSGFVVSSPSGALAATDGSRMALLERELEFLRGKLTRKDKVVSELQRKITQSDTAHEHTRQSLATCRQELHESKEVQKRMSLSLKQAEDFVQTSESTMKRAEGKHIKDMSEFENRVHSQSTSITDLAKANRALQNERAVLQAAVEARESKLTKMSELQASLQELSAKVAQHDTLRRDLETSNHRYNEIKQDLTKIEELEMECRMELSNAKETIERLNIRLDQEQEKTFSCHSQLDALQKKIQQLKGERNSYKQKNDSLSKEVSRLCRNGRNIKDIEKVLADHQALVDETETLRKQKRKALEEAHMYRTSYEQSKVAQQMAGIDTETRTALERNAELERLLAEMTEYVNAKEMQLDTLKQVNDHLQKEIRTLARANLDRNEV